MRARAMSKASKLMERVLDRMEERKLYAFFKNNVHDKNEEIPEYYNPERRLSVNETYRSNGTSEDVTVTILGCVPCSKWGTMQIAFKIKVPKDASDRVIDKRLDEVEKFVRG